MKSVTILSVLIIGSAALSADTNTHRVASERYRWQNVEIVGGGFVSGILYHPKQKDLVYARTDIGGAYRWNPSTKRWIPLLDWIQRPDWNLYGVESIGLDPSDPKRLYLALGTYDTDWGTNGAILRSTDQGRSFKRTNVPFKLGGNMDGRSIGERLAVDPNFNRIVYFGSRDNGLWMSRDFGATWAQQNGFPLTGRTDGIGICFEVFDPRTGSKNKPSSTLYAGVSGSAVHLYRSTDYGRTWAAVPGQPARLTPHHAAFDPNGDLVITYANGPGPNGLSDGAVWKLNPNGDKWKNITPNAGKGFGYAGLALDPQHPGTMVVTSLDRWSLGDDVFRTTDWGAHWSGYKDSAKLDSSGSPFLNWGQKAPRFGWWMGTVAIDPFNANRILYGTGATIWGTDNATDLDKAKPTLWTVRAQGLEETAVIDIVSPPKGAHLFSGLGDIGGFRHDDLRKVPPDGMPSHPLLNNTDSIDFAENNPLIVVRVGRGGNDAAHGGVSIDGGHTWKPFQTEPHGSHGSGHIAVSADGSVIVWTPDRGNANFSRDLGATWTPCQGASSNLQVYADRIQPGKFYGYDERKGVLFISQDAGASFHPVCGNLPTGVVRLRVSSAPGGDLWMTVANSLYHSKNGGLRFEKITTISEVGTVGLGKAPSGKTEPTLFAIGTVGDKQGAFRSDNSGESWVWISDSDHGFGTMDQIVGDPRIYGRVYIGTNGRGVLFGDPARN